MKVVVFMTITNYCRTLVSEVVVIEIKLNDFKLTCHTHVDHYVHVYRLLHVR